MVQAGRVEAIWIKRVRGGPMDPVDRATLEAGRGIVGNANQGGRRQVTIIEREAWERLMAELGASLDPSVRRANLMVSGISLRESRGKHLVIGSCRIELHGETRPCRRLDELLPGLTDAMRRDWGGGVFGAVIQGGEIRVGDEVLLLDAEARSPSVADPRPAPAPGHERRTPANFDGGEG